MESKSPFWCMIIGIVNGLFILAAVLIPFELIYLIGRC